MDLALVQQLMEQREAVNKKFDQQIAEAMGMAPIGVSIGISMDDVGVKPGESFSSLPTEIRPSPGFYCLSETMSSCSFQVEVISIDKTDQVELNWDDGKNVRVFNLPLSIFNALFVEIDKDII